MHNRLLFLAALMLATACSDSNVGTNNSPPEVTVLQPEDAFAVAEGVEITFLGRAEDRGTNPDELEMRWSSSLDEFLYEGLGDSDGISSFTTAELSPGEHVITLRAIDSVGAAATDAIVITVTQNEAPEINITSPSPEGIYYLDYPVTLQADVSDLEDNPEDLRVSWTVDASGEVLASDIVPTSSGEAVGSANLDQGNWVLVATVTDTAGKTDSDTITISVGEANSPPTCGITGPANGTAYALGAAVTIEGVVDDVDVPMDWLVVEFSSSLGGVLCSLPPQTEVGDVDCSASNLVEGMHTITMLVHDEVGASCFDTVDLTISSPPTAVITSPNDSETFNNGETITLTGTVADAEDSDETLGVTWESDVDGVLASPTPDSSGAVAHNFTLSPGTHLLTLTALDSTGLTGTDTVTVTVNAEACMSLWFDGSDDGIAVPHSNSLNLGGGSYTVEAWVYRNGGTGVTDTIFAKRASSGSVGWAMNYHNGIGAFRHTLTQSGYPNLDAYDSRASQWIHVAGTYDHATGERALWIDGNIEDSGVVSFPAYASTAELRLAWDGRLGDGYYFDGGIDEMRMSSGVLYSSPFTPDSHLSTAASTVALWKFDSGSGSIAVDSSGNGHDGTISGALWNPTCPGEDLDGDGYSNLEDCDDTDPTIYPQAGDTYGDGVDSDCDGLDCEAASDSSTYFTVCPSPMDRSTAQSSCQSGGYDGLATVLSGAEHSFLNNLAVVSGAVNAAGTQEYWLGLNDQAVEGSYVWSSGLSFGYSSWASNPPNPGPDPPSEDCVMAAAYTNYDWHDVVCSLTLYWPACESR